MISQLEANGNVVDGASAYRARVLTPFENRPLEVHFTESELESLTTAKQKAPETVFAEDDN